MSNTCLVGKSRVWWVYMDSHFTLVLSSANPGCKTSNFRSCLAHHRSRVSWFFTVLSRQMRYSNNALFFRPPNGFLCFLSSDQQGDCYAGIIILFTPASFSFIRRARGFAKQGFEREAAFFFWACSAPNRALVVYLYHLKSIINTFISRLNTPLKPTRRTPSIFFFHFTFCKRANPNGILHHFFIWYHDPMHQVSCAVQRLSQCRDVCF